MQSTSILLVAAVVVLAGCSGDAVPTASVASSMQHAADMATKQPARAQNPKSREAERPPEDEKPAGVGWNPELLDGGYMFADAGQFGDYVREAQIVAAGVLTQWDGTKGNVRLNAIIHGTLNDQVVSITATGGIVRPQVGDRVLFLLAQRDGELKLHSFCGASGMYAYSEDLATAIRKHLPSNE